MPSKIVSDASDILTRADHALPPTFVRTVCVAYLYFLTACTMLGFVAASVGCFTFSVLGSKSGTIVSGSWILISLVILVVGIAASFLVANAAAGLRRGTGWGWKVALVLVGLSCLAAIVVDVLVHENIHHYHTLFDIPVVISGIVFAMLFLPSTRESAPPPATRRAR